MCDLNPRESRDVLESLSEIRALADQLAAHSTAIQETAYMDHANLATLLTALRDRADTAREWVEAKPRQHAGHQGH
ncbi:hypothetical protein [Nonomuraea sp. 3-1Str]|uniref:hypothetical protein n=1 Tax=unclassified Nonomuraea TaxID=2593643 RepID=UPI002858C71F|nr:hypothetical protein [Nonomuraea sp. 3-1Str]MDR8408413.1 hypothetical protein [Nonomuraea sp. 3-1Str]